MGLFLETVIAKTSDLSKVKQSLSDISKEKPKFDLKSDECKYSQGGKGIQILLNEDCVGYEELAKDLSEKILSYVMLLYIYNRPPRKLEKCRMTQQFCCQAKSVFRRNTVCISRKMDFA